MHIEKSRKETTRHPLHTKTAHFLGLAQVLQWRG